MHLPYQPPGNKSADPHGLDRRDFVKTCMMAAASVGLSASAGIKIAEAAKAGLKPSVIWLHFQECTGCTESLLRASHPAVCTFILVIITRD
jgi:hydrogenase small subunit